MTHEEWHDAIELARIMGQRERSVALYLEHLVMHPHGRSAYDLIGDHLSGTE